MKNFLIKLGDLDRRWVFLLIGLSVLIPLLKPELIQMPVKTTKNTQIVFDSISKLKENDKVLISFEYGASTKPEIHPMAIALLNQLFSKGIKVYMMSLWPEGVIMARDVLSHVDESEVFNLIDDVWIQIGQDVDGAANGDQFGWDVSMNHDGSIFAASSPYHSGLGQGSAGHVRVYSIVLPELLMFVTFKMKSFQEFKPLILYWKMNL